MSLFYTCPDCGSNLDHGEICHCKEKVARTTLPQSGERKPEKANPHRPVLARGA